MSFDCALATAAGSQRAATHAGSCLRCQVEAVRRRSLARQLNDLGAEVVPAPEGFVDRVMAGIGGQGEELVRPGSQKAFAAAGAAAILGAVTVWRLRSA